MFEQEVELEKRQSATVPLLLIVALIVVIVGFAGYYTLESRRVLTTPEAANLVSGVLKSQGPTTVSFHTGLLEPSYSEYPSDPRYRLLGRIGVIKVGTTKHDRIPVELAPKGQELLKQIAGVKKSKEKDGTETYVVPLGTRRLVDISSINMTAVGRATVQFTWQWQPNALGERFDSAGSDLKSFSTWDRQALINKYGARFYHEAPTKMTIAVVKGDQGWQVATE